MTEGALQLWDAVLFRQRADLTYESISPHVQDWTGLDPNLSRQAIHPSDLIKAELDRATFRLRHARTWQVTWVQQRCRAVAGGYEGYWENVTERIHLSQQLAEAHWKATLGAATQRLVHDFNNLMTGILSLSDAYLLRLAADDRAREGLQLINQNARQAADIVHQIGGLFRDAPGRRSYQNLVHLAAGAADMLCRVLPKYSTLKLDAKQETVPIYVDPVDLRRTVVSLGLALTPPINLEVGLERGRAHLTIRGVAAAASAAQLMAEGFAERNDARFKAEKTSYTLEFPVSDYTEAERQQRCILLISDEMNIALPTAELLRRNGYDAVIGSEELRRSTDYQFDAVAAMQEASGSLSQPPDVVFGKSMSDRDMLAAVGAIFSERL